jgi:hypothetical protein
MDQDRRLMTLHACPHCHQPGVSSSQKLNSLLFVPAGCGLCGKRSCLHYVHGLRAMIAWVVLSWLFIGIALYQGLWIYLFGTIPALLFAVDKFLLNAPLLRVD